MLIYKCVIPQIDVNDKIVVVNDFIAENGDYVEKFDVILSLETAKAVSDYYTEETGYICYVVEEGDELSIGDVVAVIFDNEQEALDHSALIKVENEKEKPSFKATAKAKRLAEELKIDLAKIRKNGIIKEKDVQNYFDNKE